MIAAALIGAMLAAIPARAGPASAAATATATATGSASAEVIAALVVTRTADLDFGTILASPAAGTVTVSPAGAVGFAGGARPACGAAACGGPHAARFLVRGEPGRAYTVVAPVQVIASGQAAAPGAATPQGLLVDDLTVQTASRGGAGGTLDSGGDDSFNLGGTLRLPAGTPPARYRAVVPVTVIYG